MLLDDNLQDRIKTTRSPQPLLVIYILWFCNKVSCTIVDRVFFSGSFTTKGQIPILPSNQECVFVSQHGQVVTHKNITLDIYIFHFDIDLGSISSDRRQVVCFVGCFR